MKGIKKRRLVTFYIYRDLKNEENVITRELLGKYYKLTVFMQKNIDFKGLY